jgi:hypothetical protein
LKEEMRRGWGRKGKKLQYNFKIDLILREGREENFFPSKNDKV